MSDVKSKNLYELLGNTSDQDSDREPEPPTKAVEKPAPRLGKRDAPAAAPAEPVGAAAAAGGAARGGRGGRRGGFSGNEAAFRERATGRTYNRDQPTGEGEDTGRPGRERGPGAARPSGRGQRGPRRGGDRHSRTGLGEHQKQADQGWGHSTGEGELADEKAGEAIATEEIKEGGPVAEVNTEPAAAAAEPVPEAEPEPEDTSKSYAEYLAEKAAKKLEGLGLKEARAPNEGAKENKKWKSAKELTKAEEEATYFQGDAKQKRERERKGHKEFVEIDYSFKEQPREARGGRGGPRGGGRGRGDRPERGDYRGRGEYRGRGRGDFAARGDAPRGEYRGRGRGRGDAPAAVAVNDESAFPSLGSK